MRHNRLRHRALLFAVAAAAALGACEAQTATPGQTRPAAPSVAASVPPESPAATPGALATSIAGAPWNATALVDEVQPKVVAIVTDQGEGSGVVLSADGIIVTNHHVIEGASQVAAVFADGERMPAEVVASDPRSDLAALRVEATNLTPATFSDQVPNIGELALAMGNPLGFEGSVTMGIVSGVHRAIPGSPILVDLIQTDAPISPGNSGGALVGVDGRVIGINVAYIPPTASAVSIGFAIPAPTVTDVVEQLLEDGTVAHAYLGARFAPVNAALAAEFELGVDHGVLVRDVEPGSPASESLQPGDVIIAFDGQPVDELGDLLVGLRRHDPGDRVQMEIVRGDETLTADVTLGEVPAN